MLIYNIKTYNVTTYNIGGLLERGAYFIFHSKGRLMREGGIFERVGGLNRKITRIMYNYQIYFLFYQNRCDIF